MIDPTTLVSQHPVWAALAAAAAIAACVAKGFEWCDAALNDDSRFKLSLWLVSVPGGEQIDAWAGVFPNLIDRIFGRKALSWTFFLRSCVASFVAIAFVSILGAIMYGPDWIFGYGFGYLSHDSQSLALALTLGFTGVGALIANCIPDYLSVLVSRYFVGAMARNPRGFWIFLLLIGDTISTLIVADAAMWALHLIIDHVFRGTSWMEMGLVDFFGLLTLGMYRNLFLASLFTSIWVWLYILASVAIRILQKLQFVWVKLVPILDVEKNPMQAIGRVAGVMAGCGYLAQLGGVWLFEHL
jgi:hypothetical protein